jgi:hypothetical protein
MPESDSCTDQEAVWLGIQYSSGAKIHANYASQPTYEFSRFLRFSAENIPGISPGRDSPGSSDLNSRSRVRALNGNTFR